MRLYNVVKQNNNENTSTTFSIFAMFLIVSLRTYPLIWILENIPKIS